MVDSSADPLTARELEALRGAGVWYAKYHAGRVSDRAGDGASSAVAERDEYLELLAALRKLGVRLRVPDGLPDPVTLAA